MKTARVVLLALLLPCLEIRPQAAEAVLPLRTNDVIAFIGGANMVALAQSGHLETLLTLQHPHHKLRFRSLAWEGDTVFAQPRDVNYPDLVTQLKQVGATVALVQFGQMESLAGEAGLTNFLNAYEVLLDRISSICPRILLLRPTAEIGAISDRLEKHRYGIPPASRYQDLVRYSGEIRTMTLRRKGEVRMLLEELEPSTRSQAEGSKDEGDLAGLEFQSIWLELLNPNSEHSGSAAGESNGKFELRRAIAEKNRLWFDYARPSNWAFLAGDRTEQAFSRDYRDRNIRAFAQEMQQFLPLIADAEKHIDELAAKAAADKESTR
jgi:hypothetical protein